MKKLLLPFLLLSYPLACWALDLRSMVNGANITPSNVTASGTISATHVVATDTVRAAKVTITGSNAVPFTIGVSTLYVNGATGNVGVGTTNPLAKLMVTSGSTEIPALGAAGGGFIINQGAAANFGLQAGVNAAGNTWMQAARNDGTATAYNMLLQPLGGSVGVGTTNPIQKLDIAGNITNSGVIHSSGTGTNIFKGRTDILSGVNDGPVFVWTGASAGMRWQDSTGGIQTIFPWDNTFGQAGAFHIQRAGFAGTQKSGWYFDTDASVYQGVPGFISTFTASTGGLALSGPLAITDADQGQPMFSVIGHASAGALDATYVNQFRSVALGTQNQGTLIHHAETAAGRAALDVSNGTGRMLRVDGDSNIYLGYGVGRSTYSPTGGLALSGPLTSASYIQMASKTVAQLEAITPTATGQQYYCSDCSNAVHVVVSTGSAVCQFDAFTGGTAWH